LPSQELHERDKRCADLIIAHLNVCLDWIVVGRPMIILPVLAHIAVHSLPHPDIAARATQELRSTSGQFNEAGGGKWAVREVGRRSACVVLQKRKEINDGHIMDLRLGLLVG
jgi:hypothetical protein